MWQISHWFVLGSLPAATSAESDFIVGLFYVFNAIVTHSWVLLGTLDFHVYVRLGAAFPIVECLVGHAG